MSGGYRRSGLIEKIDCRANTGLSFSANHQFETNFSQESPILVPASSLVDSLGYSPLVQLPALVHTPAEVLRWRESQAGAFP